MSREAREELRELDDAEMRIERGNYGQCEVCGGAISDPRLEALPTARRCIELHLSSAMTVEGF